MGTFIKNTVCAHAFTTSLSVFILFLGSAEVLILPCVSYCRTKVIIMKIKFLGAVC